MEILDLQPERDVRFPPYQDIPEQKGVVPQDGSRGEHCTMWGSLLICSGPSGDVR
jgi:hypothetical protein